MKNCEAAVFVQSNRRKSLQYYRVVWLFFLFASLIRYVNLIAERELFDESLKILQFDDPQSSFRSIQNGTASEKRFIDRVSTRTERQRWNESSTNRSSSPHIDTNNSAFDNVFDENVLQINDDESFLWQGAQSRLCTSIKKKRKQLKSQKNLHLKLVTSCQDIDERNQHGNYMIGLYAMKLAAMTFQANFSFRCLESERKDYLLWWLQSQDTTPAVEPTSTLRSAMPNNEGFHYIINNTLYTPSQPTPDVACRGMGNVALHYTSEYVRQDMRAMAVRLLPSMESKGITIDEVAIHLRCGDMLHKNVSPNDNNYGLVQFQAYRKRIPSSVKSIGIVTAPFEEKNRRKQDLGSGKICRVLVSELVDYLETHFPEAEVRVRNNPKESIPEVVSRLILAKYNFCVRSTFCLLPSIASFGISYVQKGGAAYFIEEVSKVYNDMKLMDEPFLYTRDIRERGLNSTLVNWLTEN